MTPTFPAQLAASAVLHTDWIALEIAALQILTVFFLVFLNGFFVAAEFAIVKVRDSQIASLAVQGTKRVKIARHVIAHLDAYLSATQLGITLASLALGPALPRASRRSPRPHPHQGSRKCDGRRVRRVKFQRLHGAQDPA